MLCNKRAYGSEDWYGGGRICGELSESSIRVTVLTVNRSRYAIRLFTRYWSQLAEFLVFNQVNERRVRVFFSDITSSALELAYTSQKSNLKESCCG